ncbi:DUF4159 domain-containing protein [Limibacillus halophilus]|uniref:N-terminal double-transmembrane domain-containing protein n=1 Tax=Limibacillus halophilus TaxID=1579333 RepID=A0A839SU06_9PROT|nr:DUF4159 domain-containing protein [Limibacillus halophilus]MBB3065972.1 hypothetical protein [Limibacillus halophilus]
MLNLGIIAFAQPWVLLGLGALPVLWLLLRVTPPAPKRQLFPALRLLLGLKPTEETPARTPWWLLALRMLIAALLVVAAAEPLFNPSAWLAGRGPLLLVIDDGWSAAPRWEDRVTSWNQLIERAERQQRQVILATTAEDTGGQTGLISDQLSPAQARERLSALQPKPWPVNRRALLESLTGLALQAGTQAFWLSDGLASDGAAELATTLQRLGSLTLISDPPTVLAKTLLPPEHGAQNLGAIVRRSVIGAAETVAVEAYAENGRLLGRSEALFEPDAGEVSVSFDLPIELRNEAVRLSLASAGGRSAAGVALLDERWRRRPVGLFSPDRLAADKPLLGELFFLEKALAPFSELRRGSIEELLSRDLSMLILADSGTLSPEEHDTLVDWVEAGGLLVRFSGPRLLDAVAATGGSPQALLLPVRLRPGDRLLTGSLAWGQSGTLADFPPDSPFHGLAGSTEVSIGRQVLAEPSLDLANKTWARLEDGTPLVTSAPQGEGRLVLFHTSANSSWSNLPLSGLFVDMLRRIVEVSEGVEASAEGTSLPPIQLLNGFGHVVSPWSEAGELTDPATKPSAATPPGLYGLQGERRAVNLGPNLSELAPFEVTAAGVIQETYQRDQETNLLTPLLTAALLLATLDLLIALLLRGLVQKPRFLTAAGSTGAVLGFALLVSLPFGALAQQSIYEGTPQDPELFALEASNETRLAYVLTGVPSIDRVSEAGLTGLTLVLRQRTSITAAAPFAVQLGRDELAFFPLLYWPVTREQRPLDATARQAVADYMRNGGTIVFDLQEERVGRGLGGLLTPGEAALRAITAGLDLPPLAPIDPDHVLTKAFYLLQDFPGRLQGGLPWVENVGEEQNDGVASLIITSGDWAGAWAIDDRGAPILPVTPGGERQREMAYRVGVNLVMYALTGNYKADQVHVPFILERLGQ